LTNVWLFWIFCCAQKVSCHFLYQFGPITLDLRAISQKHDNLWATSNKMIKKTIESQCSKLRNYYTIVKSNSLQSLLVGCLWSRLHCCSFVSTSVSGSKLETVVHCFVCHTFLFFELTCFLVGNVLSHTYVLANIKCILMQNSSVWESDQNLIKLAYRDVDHKPIGMLMKMIFCWLFSGSSLQSSPGFFNLHVMVH